MPSLQIGMIERILPMVNAQVAALGARASISGQSIIEIAERAKEKNVDKEQIKEEN